MKKLREKAEKEAARTEVVPQDVDVLTQELIHELQVHQIELEMQNEELRRAQTELEESRSRYADLYDFSPVGYLTLDRNAIVLEANLTAAEQLGLERGRLIRNPLRSYIAHSDRDRFYAHLQEVFGGKGRGVCEIQFRKADGGLLSARLDMMLVRGRKETEAFRITITDIGEQKRLLSELERERARLNAMIENAPEGIVVTDSNASVILTNRVAERLYGRPVPLGKGFESHAAFQLLRPDGILYEPHDFPLTRSALEGETHTNDEMMIVWPDGQERYLLVNSSPTRDKAGHITGAVGIFQDITERREREREVSRLNEELKRHVADLETANQGLEVFAYSVSHDLRAPLRAIDGFSLALLEDYAEQLDATGKDYLNRVRSSARTMGKLIDALLSLSHVTRAEVKHEEANLSTMAATIAAGLQKTQPEREVEFIIQQGLRAKGDGEMLRSVLENLLGNAWKFTSKRPDARIEFGAVQTETETIYFVRDNGVGFEMKYGYKLFVAFERLHAASEFPGIGIGLATVARIIHRHGGRIWAEGEIEKGATFCFTLGPQGEGEVTR